MFIAPSQKGTTIHARNASHPEKPRLLIASDKNSEINRELNQWLDKQQPTDKLVITVN
jgi:hypothetical protein